MPERSRPWHERTPAIVCLGLSALDYIWAVERLPVGSDKVLARQFATKGGGMAATAAVAVARLGGHAAFWGRAGDDLEGRLMRRSLQEENVAVGAFRLFPDARSSVSCVVVDEDGERQIANFRGSNLPLDSGWLPLTDIPQTDAILADPRWPEGTLAAFAAARAAGVPTVLDADVALPEVFEAVLPLTDHAIFSTPALAAFAGSDRHAALRRVGTYGCEIAAVTSGSGGVSWLSEGRSHHQPAYPVEAVDTTGAGDVFHGAYALAIGSGAPVAEAMAFAAAAAALKCTRPDGRSGIPGLAETLAFQGNR